MLLNRAEVKALQQFLADVYKAPGNEHLSSSDLEQAVKRTRQLLAANHSIDSLHDRRLKGQVCDKLVNQMKVKTRSQFTAMELIYLRDFEIKAIQAALFIKAGRKNKKSARKAQQARKSIHDLLRRK